jgi:large subunit ribosomal protein L10
MTRAEKAGLIEDLTESFKSSDAIAVCDYKGLTVTQLETLRKDVRKRGGSVQVIKNTLASIALKNAEKEGLELDGTNIFIWGEDQLEVSKAVADFAKDNKELFIIKKGYFDGGAVEASHIEALSKLPGRDELIGMLLSVWTAPLRNMVTGLDNLAKKKAEEEA